MSYITSHNGKCLFVFVLLQHPDADSLYLEEIDVGEESKNLFLAYFWAFIS